ncbi:hypothetical protein GUJ93_ZPchr0002g25848 [Zizania palustris]|uniref:BHLH domain-containing protein n=1 Tax=Zizania palustris TaxID=103762 RepID=A0A8J5V4B5_ZIZPA|nr:hypothetical protein GUJ93_ZPchr0002g25848 [Zizania palustris]
MADGGLCELFADDLFSIIETWEECISGGAAGAAAAASAAAATAVGVPKAGNAVVVGARNAANARRREAGGRDEEKGRGGPPAQKKQKGQSSLTLFAAAATSDNEGGSAANKVSHITVERNRRKQMNEHLSVLRSLMPCFYVKRGDQASIIGGVVDYIKELQQVLRSLEAKKNRKQAYADQVLVSPRLIKSTPPISPRLAAVPISPRTPTPGSPYTPAHVGAGAGAGARPPPHLATATSASSAYSYSCMSPAMTPTSSSSTTTTTQYSHHELLSPQPSAPPFLPTLDRLVTELAAHAARRPSPGGGGLLVPDVKVEFAGANLVLKTVSHRAPGQALKIIAALEYLSLEILHVSISTVEDMTVLSFTIKIGIECELSAEELVQEIQQTFL